MNQIINRVTRPFKAALIIAIYSMVQTVMALEVGDKMPDFKLSASDGSTYTLSQFHGKQPVVIAFFPKTFTPG